MAWTDLHKKVFGSESEPLWHKLIINYKHTREQTMQLIYNFVSDIFDISVFQTELILLENAPLKYFVSLQREGTGVYILKDGSTSNNCNPYGNLAGWYNTTQDALLAIALYLIRKQEPLDLVLHHATEATKKTIEFCRDNAANWVGQQPSILDVTKRFVETAEALQAALDGNELLSGYKDTGDDFFDEDHTDPHQADHEPGH